ncbi:MAG: type II toxin-antitoxin system prevent-host-death family antitoxin [Vicinamibacterales bacterium]
MPAHKSVSAAEANRGFSKLLKSVKEGRSVVVTSHGKAVARIVPVSEGDPARDRVRASLLMRLGKERPVNIGRWSRDDLYKDAE